MARSNRCWAATECPLSGLYRSVAHSFGGVLGGNSRRRTSPQSGAGRLIGRAKATRGAPLYFGHAYELTFVDKALIASGFVTATAKLLGRWSVVRGLHMSVLSGATPERTLLPPRRQVSIGCDGGDFVVAFQPHNIVVFRHNEAHPLRRICHSLRWEIVNDTFQTQITLHLGKGAAVGRRLNR